MLGPIPAPATWYVAVEFVEDLSRFEITWLEDDDTG